MAAPPGLDDSAGGSDGSLASAVGSLASMLGGQRQQLERLQTAIAALEKRVEVSPLATSEKLDRLLELLKGKECPRKEATVHDALAACVERRLSLVNYGGGSAKKTAGRLLRKATSAKVAPFTERKANSEIMDPVRGAAGLSDLQTPQRPRVATPVAMVSISESKAPTVSAATAAGRSSVHGVFDRMPSLSRSGTRSGDQRGGGVRASCERGRRTSARHKWSGLLASHQATEQILGSRALMTVDDSDRFQPRKAVNVPALVLKPTSTLRVSWDVVSIVLITYITISLPYRLAFYSELENFGLAAFDFLIDIFFLCDLIINFRTAYVRDGELVSSPVRIARNYLRSWFLLDLCSSLPIEWFLFGVRFHNVQPNVSAAEGDGHDDSGRTATQLASVLKTFKVLKLVRLLRLARLLRYSSKLQVYISDNSNWLNSNVIRLLKLSVLFSIVCHWNACLQFFMADLAEFPADSWVVRGGLVEEGGGRVVGAHQYTYAVFCAASQMLAMDAWNGGIVPPVLQAEFVCNLLSILVGSMLYAVLIASLTAVLSESDPAARAYRAKVDTVNAYMRYAQLPSELRSKLREYLELAYPAKCAFDEDAILAELTAPLRQQVHLHKCGHVLETLHVVHTGGDPGMPGAIAAALQHVVFVVGDYIMREGTRPEGMYFLTSGTVEVVKGAGSGKEQLITSLSSGSFFGEMALLSATGRAMASIRVTSSVEGHHLSRKRYLELIDNFPSFRTYLSTVHAFRCLAPRVLSSLPSFEAHWPHSPAVFQVAKLRLESREERQHKVRISRWRQAVRSKDVLARIDAGEHPRRASEELPHTPNECGRPKTLPGVSAQKMQATFRANRARHEMKQQQASALVLQKAMRGRAAHKAAATRRSTGPGGPRVSGFLVQRDSCRRLSMSEAQGCKRSR